MFRTKEYIYWLLNDLTGRIKDFFHAYQKQAPTCLKSITLTKKKKPWEMLSLYMQQDLERQYGIHNNNFSNLKSTTAKQMKRKIKSYYEKTAALPLSKEEIRIIANEIALKLESIYSSESNSALDFLSIVTSYFGVPMATEVSEKHFDPQYWRKNISKYAQISEENLAFELDLIGNNYSSYSAQQRYTENLNANTAYLNSIREKGDPASLRQANAIQNRDANHISFLNAKIAGLLRLKNEHNYDAVMVTITCPPDIRTLNNISGGIKHLKQTQKCLNSFRSKQRLCLAGSTSIEPHQNGYAHLHTYVFGEKKHLEIYIQYFKSLVTVADSSLCDKIFNVTWEDDTISSLCRYVAKNRLYPSIETAAWYKACNCQRLEFFGLPSDDIWLTLRKEPFKYKNNIRLHTAQLAAKNSDYSTFCTSLGGIGASRKDRPYSFVYKAVTNKFNCLTKRKVGAYIFKTFISRKHVLRRLIDIVTTIYPRYSHITQNPLTCNNILRLRAPPKVPNTTQTTTHPKSHLNN